MSADEAEASPPAPGAIHRSLIPAFDAESYDAERAQRYARREGLHQRLTAFCA